MGDSNPSRLSANYSLVETLTEFASSGQAAPVAIITQTCAAARFSPAFERRLVRVIDLGTCKAGTRIECGRLNSVGYHLKVERAACTASVAASPSAVSRDR
jgi:hypothetical protein